MSWNDYFSKVIIPELRLLSAIVLGCLLIATTGVPFTWLVIAGLIAFVVYHFYQHKLLISWIKFEQNKSPPDSLNGIGHVLAMEVHQNNKQHRAAQARSKQMIGQFRKVSMALPDGILILDVHGRLEWFNDSAARLLGLRKAQDRGRTITNLVRDPAFVKFYNQCREGENLRLNSPTNNKVKLDIRITPYNDKKLLIVQDFTTLQHMEQVRQDFVANVSHELRTPLSVIVGYIETLDDDDSPEMEPYHPIFWQIKQQSDRMTRLVEDLLMLSNLENDRTVHSQTEVAVPKMLDSIVDDALIMSGPKNQDIQLEADEDLWLRGNTRELHGIFTNLVSNAVNYTPALGTITIRWYATDEHAVMEVEDDGIGIEPQHIHRLTERFYRADKGRSRSAGGTGLGLAIVKHALQRHDATLDIISEPSLGSTFRCLFPLNRSLSNPFDDDAEDPILTPYSVE